MTGIDTRPASGPTTDGIEGWVYRPRGIAVRLFLTCWLVYTLHFATNVVREIYPALALGDRFSFRVDEYAHMHPDLFERPGYGWHIGNNPGASMVAAVPYALARVAIDPIVRAVNRRRAASGAAEPPAYGSPWPMARRFYAESWRRGYDVKFALGAFVMQAFCMAPFSAAGAVLMFLCLRRVVRADAAALGLALVYAFGTPVFFRTGYLNQNLMLGIMGFAGFLALWNQDGALGWPPRRRWRSAGLAGGLAVLFDYSGVVLLAGLFGYGAIRAWREGAARAARTFAWDYGCGALGPIALLWFYQWRAFGNPFLPGQHWMPPVQWIERGYQGFGWPQAELLGLLAFDHRFGFFVASPLMLLAALAPLLRRRDDERLPALELGFLLVQFAAFWVFFSCSNYVRLQFNTGVRYMTPMLPFLFVPAAVVLRRLPRPLLGAAVVLAVFESWALAMYRDVESPLGILDPILKTLVGGFQLPALQTLARMGEPFASLHHGATSPLPLLALAGALVFVIWSRPRRG